MTLQPNSGLFAAFGGGPQLAVGGNVNVQSNAFLFLGCEPYAQPCFNDPNADSGGSLTSKGTIGGNLHSDGAYAVVVHYSYVGHDLTIHGGGGGYNCDTAGFFTVEDVTVGHNATLDGLQTCWGGFFRTNVGGNLRYTNNATADPEVREPDGSLDGGSGEPSTGGSPARSPAGYG